MTAVAKDEDYVLSLTALQCRHVAQYLCKQVGLPRTEATDEKRLQNCAAMLMRLSDGRRGLETVEINNPLGGFLWLQKRLWKGVGTDKVLNAVWGEISRQMAKQQCQRGAM